jgi:peroxiredoxin
MLMRGFHISNPKIKQFLPFVLSFLAILFFTEHAKSLQLPPPQMKIVAPDERKGDDTDFTLPDLQGNSVRLSDLKGNVVLLNFFATWCPPCREEMPSLEELYLTYRNKGFVVLGVSNDAQGKKVVEPFIKKYESTFPVVLDSKSEVSRQYLVRGLPTTYLLDRQGRIAGISMGGADWNDEEAHALIEQLLQEPKASEP